MRAGRGHELAEAILARGELVVTAAGGSMLPTIGIGDKVRVVRGAVAVGEVGLFRVPTGFLLHRVIARLPGGLVVHAGDCPGAQAGLARETALLGRADLPLAKPSLGGRIRALAGAFFAHRFR